VKRSRREGLVHGRADHGLEGGAHVGLLPEGQMTFHERLSLAETALLTHIARDDICIEEHDGRISEKGGGGGELGAVRSSIGVTDPPRPRHRATSGERP
jgi:hypothetical protein